MSSKKTNEKAAKILKNVKVKTAIKAGSCPKCGRIASFSASAA
jgi:4-hydroxy-3-methylbut-2-en-1-yl diphosphate synthase IspG/GcpE